MSTAYGSIGQSLIGSTYGVQQASSQQYQMYLQNLLMPYQGQATLGTGAITAAPAKMQDRDARHASTVTDNEAWLDRRVNEIRVAL